LLFLKIKKYAKSKVNFSIKAGNLNCGVGNQYKSGEIITIPINSRHMETGIKRKI